MSQRIDKHSALSRFTVWGMNVCAVMLCSFTVSTLSADDSFRSSLPPSLVESGLMDQLMNPAPPQPNHSPAPVASDRLEARRAAMLEPTPLQQSNAFRQIPDTRDSHVGQALYAEPSQPTESRQVMGERILQHPADLEPRFDAKQSFIQREQTNRPQAQANGPELIRRLGINLIFVLACAAGVLLVIKQWQSNRQNSPANAAGKEGAIVINQVQKLAHGASLQVVEVVGNQFLVAMDATGIRSVKPLVQGFDQTLDRASNFEHEQRLAPSEPVVHDESTAEIDENLIRLLLSSSKRAA